MRTDLPIKNAHPPQKVDRSLCQIAFEELEKPSAPHNKKPSAPTRFQTPTGGRRRREEVSKVLRRRSESLQKNSLCHPRAIGFNFHHRGCTSTIKSSEEITNPIPPRT